MLVVSTGSTTEVFVTSEIVVIEFIEMTAGGSFFVGRGFDRLNRRSFGH